MADNQRPSVTVYSVKSALKREWIITHDVSACSIKGRFKAILINRELLTTQLNKCYTASAKLAATAISLVRWRGKSRYIVVSSASNLKLFIALLILVYSRLKKIWYCTVCWFHHLCALSVVSRIDHKLSNFTKLFIQFSKVFDFASNVLERNTTLCSFLNLWVVQYLRCILVTKSFPKL